MPLTRRPSGRVTGFKMTSVLNPPSEEHLDAYWVNSLASRLEGELAGASRGHCLRVEGLPRPLLERLAQHFEGDGLAAEIYLIDRVSGPEGWRVGVHKVVERRNAEEGVVVALLPPDVQLAAGDSVDISTFRQLSTGDLTSEVERNVLAQIDEPYRRRCSDLLNYLVLKGWPLSPVRRLRYLVNVQSQGPLEGWELGAALYELGLIPDFNLFETPEDFHYRIGQKNIPTTELLKQATATPLERVLRLPLTSSEFRNRLLELFEEVTPEQVDVWGALIATESEWTGLSLENWPLTDTAPPPGHLRIDIAPLRLPRREDGVLVYEKGSKILVGWETNPPPLDMPGLTHFRIELLSSDRVVAWESPLFKAGTGKTARRSRTLKDLGEVENGVYFFRVVALNVAGDPFAIEDLRDPDQGPDSKKTNESEDFLLIASDEVIETEDVEAVANVNARSFAEAEMLARWSAIASGKPLKKVTVQELSWNTPLQGQSETATAVIRFDLQRQYSVRLSQRLRRVEIDILSNSQDGGHRRLHLDRRFSEPERLTIELPHDFARAREALFSRLLSEVLENDELPVVSLIDLCSMADLIEEYATRYQEWLDVAESEALLVDTVETFLPDYGEAVLVSPTHPLRLLWMLQEQELGRAWSSIAAERAEAAPETLESWRSALAPELLPSLLILDQQRAFLDAGALPGGWGVYLPSRVRDSRALLAGVRRRLGAGAAHHSEADVPPRILADKFQAFLTQHPYTPCLVLNVINPGDGALVVDALVELETRQGKELPLRYEVRLFSDAAKPEMIGSAFRELLDPELQISEAAARLAGPGRSFLFPKMSWSRKLLAEFAETPERFPAHLTMILDAFPVSARVTRGLASERTSFVHGLIQEAPRRFVGKGNAFTWIRRSAPTPCPELPTAPGRSGLIANLMSSLISCQARTLAPGTDASNSVAVSALDLTTHSQAMLYSAHAVSTWVLTLDPHLGLDYYDAAGSADRPGYLLDFAPEFVASGGRQLLLTTRVGEEISRLMNPALSELNIEDSELAPQLLIESLRSLSGRLALRLLSSPAQVQGALGMALSRLFLEAYGLLGNAVVIPLDAHPELSVRRDAPLAPQLRGDLLVASAEAADRTLDLLLVEAKCHSGTGLSSELRSRISAQLTSNELALQEAFLPAEENDRIERSMLSWQLSRVLDFYLERALRYGIVYPDQVDPLRVFFADLDAGYTLSTRKIGLVFRLNANESYLDEEDPDIPIWIVGRDVIDRLVQDGLRRMAEASREGRAEMPASLPAVGEAPLMRDEPTWDDVQRAFSQPKSLGKSPARQLGDAKKIPHDSAESRGISTQDGVLQDEPSPFVVQVDRGSGGGEESVSEKIDGIDEADREELLSYDVLLGDIERSPQYGLLGVPAAEKWRRIALDLNGCNTISIFGVQGGGKSYTLGSILEMALKPIQGINLLPQPLAGIVFHYHHTQDYPPEFVSMVHPNDHPEDVHLLREMGASPEALHDVLILTSADMVQARRQEFPGIDVAPIAFSSGELTASDWRFLMGATGNDAMYLKLVNEVMRKSRHNLTLANIQGALHQAPLTDVQRALASTRLDFASRFIDDSVSLRSLLKPGRMIIVDLRDEFIDRDQALGLFVTMLNVFSGGGLGSNRFNKLVVFDEAHKYMGGELINQVVEVIREMRHKGVSVIVASQDPIHLPTPVIELSSAVVLHRFNSPNWLKHIQKALSALNELTPPMLSALSPGEAFVWANRATDPVFTRRAVKTRMRPRASRHGGSTKKAVEENRDDKEGDLGAYRASKC